MEQIIEKNVRFCGCCHRELPVDSFYVDKRTLVYIKRINGQFSVATSTETNIFFNNLFHNHFLLRISTIIFFSVHPCQRCL